MHKAWRSIGLSTSWTILSKSGELWCQVCLLRLLNPSRYPTFVDAVRDIDDALCMIFLFASLPSSAKVAPSLVENCARLAAEWQLYVIHTQALRKVFLSIKGVYYQAEIFDQTVTWLVPYQFTQTVRFISTEIDR